MPADNCKLQSRELITNQELNKPKNLNVRLVWNVADLLAKKYSLSWLLVIVIIVIQENESPKDLEFPWFGISVSFVPALRDQYPLCVQYHNIWLYRPPDRAVFHNIWSSVSTMSQYPATAISINFKIANNLWEQSLTLHKLCFSQHSLGLSLIKSNICSDKTEFGI